MYEPNHITEAQVNHLCLCTGYDGVGRGLREVFPNLRTVAYVEIEAFAVANLVAKSEAEQMDAAPIFTNVKTFPYRKFRGCVDILSAGFPCQPFSAAGKRKATEDPRHLYPSIANGITLCKPRYVLLENVEGIVSAKTADGESVLLYVLRDLESRGYECAWGTFSAAEVGAPHLRKRIFILSKLGNPKHDGSSTSEDWGSTCAEQEEGRMQELEGGREQSQDELAYSKHKRLGGRFASGSSGVDGEGSETAEEGQEGDSLWGETEGCGGESREFGGSEEEQWPSRPGEEQYEWEEPRVTEAQSDMGGADDGATNRLNTTTNRVDRLRLLGNGVVPDTCTFAVRTLWNKLN
jgi:DNA (cytosine-5)-methyltransferase 1